jgi:hypothetical protein
LRGEGDGDGDGDGDSMGVRGRGCWIGLTVVMMGSGKDDESMSGERSEEWFEMRNEGGAFREW